jgi:hypothetical protein
MAGGVSGDPVTGVNEGQADAGTGSILGLVMIASPFSLDAHGSSHRDGFPEELLN